ncbi:MAG: Si-specific NAD(P)(+) transhydrogenase [Phycisphaerales bacterium]
MASDPTAFDYDLLVLGSGPAGQRAAVQAAKLGKRVGLVERSRMVGGVCLHTGTVPSKTFREAVLSLTHVPILSRGTPVERPRPTMKELLHRVNTVIERELDVVARQLSRNGIDLIAGTARFLDPHRISINGGPLERQATAEHILIACGSVPAPPPVDADHETILTSDDIIRLPKLPRSLAVIGGGVIGIEYASMFAELGVEVTLIDRNARPLEFCDHEIVDELMHQMRQKRVTFRLGETVHRIRPLDGGANGGTHGAAIDLDSSKHIEVDAALFSIGRIGATKQLGLDKAGLTADDRGRLKVNERFQTSVDHISAAGDVIGFPALASTSSEQGRLAVCSMFGVEAKPTPAGFPYGIYAIPEISMVGATEQELTAQKVPYEVGVARYEEIARGQILGDSSGFFKMIFHRETRRLLGVHCIGTQATELIHIGQAVLSLGGGLDYFLESVFNYPTLAECYKVAAYSASNHMRGG